MQPEQDQVLTIFMKILGGIAVVVSLKWLANIFKGKDGVFDQTDLKKMAAFLFFLIAAGYMIWKEGERKDLVNDVYGPIYLSIVFGGLLTVLHLTEVLVQVRGIIEAIAVLRSGTKITTTQENVNVNKDITKVVSEPI